jgi:hypothetical protein
MSKRSKAPQKPAESKKAKPAKKANAAAVAAPKKTVSAALAETVRREEASPRKATFVMRKASPPPVPPKRSAPSAGPAPATPLEPWANPAFFAAEIWGRSFRAAGRGAVDVNLTLIDIARSNVSSGLDFAKSLAAARNPLEAARVQLAFWDGRLKAFADQALALRAASATLLAGANEPVREHPRPHRSGTKAA